MNERRMVEGWLDHRLRAGIIPNWVWPKDWHVCPRGHVSITNTTLPRGKQKGGDRRGILCIVACGNAYQLLDISSQSWQRKTSLKLERRRIYSIFMRNLLTGRVISKGNNYPWGVWQIEQILSVMLQLWFFVWRKENKQVKRSAPLTPLLREFYGH